MSKRGLLFKLAIFIPLFLILISIAALAASEKTSLMDVLAGKVSFIDWMTGRQVQGTKLESFFCNPQLNECAPGLYCAESPRGGPQRCCPIGETWCQSNQQCILISSFNNNVNCPIIAQGDLDNDGDADCFDLTLLMNSVQGGGSFTAAQIAIRDINGDQVVDIFDFNQLRDRLKTSRGLVCGTGTSTTLQPQQSQNECPTLNARQRVNNTAYRICGNYDADQYLEWSPHYSCLLYQVTIPDGRCIESVLVGERGPCTQDSQCTSGLSCVEGGRCCPQGTIWCADQWACTHSSECITGVRFVGSGELPDLAIDDNVVWLPASRELRFQLKNIGRQANIPATRFSVTLSKGSQVINASLIDKTLSTQNSLTIPYSISAITLQRLIGEGQLNLEVRIDLTNRVRESNENNNIFRKTITICPAGQTLNAQLYCISTSNQYTLNIGREIELGGIRVKLVQSSLNSAILDITPVGRPIERERIAVNVNALRVSKGLAIANLFSDSTSVTLQITPVTPGTSTAATSARGAESSGAPIEFSLRQTQTIVGNEIQLVSSSTTQVLLTLVPRTGTLQYIRILAGETKPVGSLMIKNARSDATSATLEIMPP